MAHPSQFLFSGYISSRIIAQSPTRSLESFHTYIHIFLGQCNPRSIASVQKRFVPTGFSCRIFQYPANLLFFFNRFPCSGVLLVDALPDSIITTNSPVLQKNHQVYTSNILILKSESNVFTNEIFIFFFSKENKIEMGLSL